ncbi:hypothetical protein ON010_g2701 [Phytophthora cinnamomi]|nr:hypothetical protein ON010_g2701 [Phytophthora cinnamomi]
MSSLPSHFGVREPLKHSVKWVPVVLSLQTLQQSPHASGTVIKELGASTRASLTHSAHTTGAYPLAVKMLASADHSTSFHVLLRSSSANIVFSASPAVQASRSVHSRPTSAVCILTWLHYTYRKGESFLYLPPIDYYFYQSDTLTPSLACASLQTCHSRKRARAARCPAAASGIRPTSRPPRCGLGDGGLGRSLMVTVVPPVTAPVTGMSPLAPARSASPPATPLPDALATLLASPLATANLDASLGAASSAAPADSLGVSPAAPTVQPASPVRAPSDLESEFGEEDERMWEAIVRDSQQPDFAVSSPVPSSPTSMPLASPPASPAIPSGAVAVVPAASGDLSPVSRLQELIFELEVEGWSGDETTAAATGWYGSLR